MKSNLEAKVDALLNLAAATTETERQAALEEINRLRLVPAAPVMTAEEEVHKILFELGIPNHIVGYDHLATAILLCVKDPSLVHAITKGLNPAVAEAHNTEPGKCERTMRHAIELAFDRADPEVIAKYFGYTTNKNKGKATNSEFISRIANVVRSQM